METKAGFAAAVERLRRRDAESLAAFILSLAQDSGPIGDQVRTFIVGDDVGEAVESIGQRIRDLRTPSEYAHRHARGKEIGASLEYVLDAIQTLVLPAEPRRAFELLVLFFEADGQAMENCGDHDFEVTSAFERAGQLMAQAAKSVGKAELISTLERLLDDDGYGVRGALAEVIESLGKEG